MRRFLLVLDTGLLALDDKLDQEPINYLVEQQEEDQSEVVVLSLAGQTKLSSLELVLWPAPAAAYPPWRSSRPGRRPITISVPRPTSV